MERKFLLGEREGAIAKAGATEYSILITENASPAVEYAAGELARLVKKATGAVLPIVTEKTGPVISLGDNYYSRKLGISVKLSEVTRNGFAIKTFIPFLLLRYVILFSSFFEDIFYILTFVCMELYNDSYLKPI